MKPIYLIPSILIFLSIIIISNPFDAEAQTSPTHFVSVKAVVNFEHSANVNAVRNVYDTDVKPQLTTLINDYSSNLDNFSFETRTTNEALYIIGINQQNGNNIFQLYPKTIFYGTLPDGVTRAQFNNQFDNFLSDVKDIIGTELKANGATILNYHIHYTTGSVDEFEP